MIKLRRGGLSTRLFKMRGKTSENSGNLPCRQWLCAPLSSLRRRLRLWDFLASPFDTESSLYRIDGKSDYLWILPGRSKRGI